MDEKNFRDVPSDASPEISIKKTGALAWLDNFWYHYKWHSIIALFLVFAIVICSFQMCSKTSYDAFAVYAGPKEISHRTENGEVEYMKFNSSLLQVARDSNSDGETNVSLLDLFMLSSKEIEEAEKDDETEVNYKLITNNNTTFNNIISKSDYYLFFLSSSLYTEFQYKFEGTRYFESLESYSSLGNHEYFDSSAIYLKSTAFSALPGFSSLPDDTVICIRIRGYLESGNEKLQNEAKLMLEKILTYGK